jgi:hypothetical protein
VLLSIQSSWKVNLASAGSEAVHLSFINVMLVIFFACFAHVVAGSVLWHVPSRCCCRSKVVVIVCVAALAAVMALGVTRSSVELVYIALGHACNSLHADVPLVQVQSSFCPLLW